MKRQIQLLILLLTVTVSSFAQSVKDVEIRVSDNKVLVGYTISGLKNYQDISQINFYVSRDGGQTFEGPLKEITGEVGPDLRNGKYVMVWDAMKESRILSDNLIVEIRISVEDSKKDFMIAVVGNTATPFGLRIGQLGRIGWFAEFRASLMPFTTVNYTYENGSIPDYNKYGYYQFNGNNGLSAWSAVGGVTIQATRKVFFNVGVGYGVENYLYGIDEYSYETENKTGSARAKDADYSNSGFELDAGIILKFNKLIINGGATTINFKTINWLVGIGVAF